MAPDTRNQAALSAEARELPAPNRCQPGHDARRGGSEDDTENEGVAGIIRWEVSNLLAAGIEPAAGAPTAVEALASIAELHSGHPRRGVGEFYAWGLETSSQILAVFEERPELRGLAEQGIKGVHNSAAKRVAGELRSHKAEGRHPPS